MVGFYHKEGILMDTVLILGYTGKVGCALYDEFKKYDYNVIGKNSLDFNALQPESIESIIKEVKPDIIINAVAYHNIMECERNPDITNKINVSFIDKLTKLSESIGFIFVNYSTEVVFGNTESLPDEYSQPNPINVYGRTKLAGEQIMINSNSNYYVLRIPMVFGLNKRMKQFVEKMIYNDDKVIRVADDVFTTPTYSRDIAKETYKIIKHQKSGLYHVTNTERTSLYNLILELDNIKPLHKEIQKTDYKEFYDIKYKNIWSGLKTSKLIPMRSWKEAVKDYCREI